LNAVNEYSEKRSENKMEIKILSCVVLTAPKFERYTGRDPIPGYPDITQVWKLVNDPVTVYYARINGALYRITRRAAAGLYTDKATVPIRRSDWYAAIQAYLWHDTDFSCHNWAEFAEHGDGGFRATNEMFLADIDFHIRQAREAGKIGPIRAAFWHIRKRTWYRAVSSIAGQGLYVNGDPGRGYHGLYSETTIERVC
jgi:hypothetical protein